MRFLFAMIVSALLMTVAAEAQICPGQNASLRPKGFQSLPVSTVAVGLTVPAGAELAIGFLETDVVRYRDDGVNPTASVGTPLNPSTSFVICQGSLSTIRFIRQTTDAALNLAYYGR